MTWSRRHLLLSGMALCVAGCGGQARPAVARVATPQFPPSLGDPFMGLTLPSTLALNAIYDTLTVLESGGMASAGLATDWFQRDGRHWRFRLRQGARFSNGRPVDAQAICEVFDLLATPRGRRTSAGSDLAVVEACKAVSAHDIELSLSAPAPLLPASLSILRLPEPKAFRDRGADAFAARPIGSGPYTVADWTSNTIALERQAHGWRQARTDRLDLVLTPDRTARLQAVLSGTAVAALEVSPDDVAALTAIGGRLAPRRTTSVLVLNFITNQGGPVADRRVREAINLAIDRQKLIDAFLQGSTAPANQLASADGFGRNPALPAIPHDLEQARALIEQAGYGAGLTLTLVAAVGASASDSAIYQQIAMDLKAIGVDLRIRRVPPASLRQYLYNGGWPGQMFALRTGGFDALRSFRLASCRWIAPYHCFPQVEEAIGKAANAATLEDRRRATQAVLAADRNTTSAVYLWQEPSFDALGPYVSDWSTTRATIELEKLALRPL